jgi:hypothetical protein
MTRAEYLTVQAVVFALYERGDWREAERLDVQLDAHADSLEYEGSGMDEGEQDDPWGVRGDFFDRLCGVAVSFGVVWREVANWPAGVYDRADVLMSVRRLVESGGGIVPLGFDERDAVTIVLRAYEERRAHLERTRTGHAFGPLIVGV